MLVRYADSKKPTDEAYAFRLRALGAGGLLPTVPPPGTRTDIRLVAEQVLEPGDATRFEARVDRWTGPEDVRGPGGEQPYAGSALHFEERAGATTLRMEDVETVLRGTSLVLREPDRTDFVLRDHHLLDVVLYAYWTRGALPRALFHADRHSDWCKYEYLDARRPQQAATWWTLLEGLKRPVSGAPVLRQEDVCFTTAQATHEAWMGGRDVGVSRLVPLFVDEDALDYRQVLEDPRTDDADWVSVDLDYLQPSPQLALTGGLLRDRRFHALLRRAKVRVFVLSPQFLHGGDRIQRWTTQGGLHSTLRLLNLLRDSARLARLRAPR